MDFVNQAIAQLADLFRSMTPGARITAGLLLAVVVVSFGYLFQQHSAGPDEYLFGGEALPDGQLNQIEAAIAKAGLSAERREGNRIMVPTGQKAAYLAAVVDGGALPPNFHTYLEKALDQGGPMESREETRERLKIAKQQMLSEIIRAMDWVQDAIVLYDEQPPRGLSNAKQVTGSVNVKPILGETLNPHRASVLKQLVAHSVVGMNADDVAVTSLSEGTDGAEGAVYADSFKDEYYQTRVAYEQYKKQSIMGALRDIPGVRVEVNAELDNTIQETVENVKPDPKTAARRETTSQKVSKQVTTDGGGQVGTTAQGPSRQGQSDQLARQNENSDSTDTSDTENVVGGEQRRTQIKGFTPKEVWATVTIPHSYVETVWKQHNPDAKAAPKEEDLKLVQDDLKTKIENIVVPLLPRQNKGENQYKQVQMVIVDSIRAPDIVPASMSSKAVGWLGRSWTTLSMVGVAVFSLLILRSVVTSLPPGTSAGPAAAAATLSVQTEDDAPVDPAEGDSKEQRTRLRIKKGVSLKDDLVEMVHDDPDAAAAILRNWISNKAA
jgi:flagellar M-ring protein FliF